MRASLTSIACILLFLAAAAPSRGQGAVLVLSPGPTALVRAGAGITGFSGEGANATAARFSSPSALAQDSQGNLYIADTRNHRIRRVSTDGTVTTIAGTGVQGFSGDEALATQAQLDSPAGLAVSSTGEIYIADTRNQRIRRIDSSGHIHTVAGTGIAGMGGDGGLAVSARLSSPRGLALNAAGEFFIADTGNHRVRRIAADGTISTFAGSGVQADSGDGGPAKNAGLSAPSGLAFRSDGALLIADQANNRIRVVTADGTIQTLSTAGLQLRRPQAFAFTSAGDLLIADTGNFRVAQVTSSGAGTSLGSGVQGRVDSGAAPALSPFGSATSVLSGTGTSFLALDHDLGQTVEVRLPTITFPDTLVTSSSQPKTLTLQNPGSATLSISNIAYPSTFTPGAGTCAATPFQLAAKASCTLALVFTPTAEGATSGTLQVTVAGGLPQRAVLSGTGVHTGTLLDSSTSLQSSGTISYSGAAVTLTALVLGSSSPIPGGSVTFLDGTQEIGTAALNSAAQATLTTRSMTAGTHSLTARFLGDAIYKASTSLSLQQTIVLAPDFLLNAVTSTRVAVKSGDPGAIALSLQPSNGVLNHPVTLQVDGLPAGSTINVSPTTVVLAGDPVPVTVNFKLPVAVSLARRLPAIGLAGLLLLLMPLCRSRRLPALALLTLVSLQGCGGGFSGNASIVTAQSSTQTYPVTVTASSTGVTGETLTHQASFTVVVQP